MNKNLLKHILIPGVGFGVGGMIWGAEIIESMNQGKEIPIFGYLISSILLGLFGGLVLSVFLKISLMAVSRSVIQMIKIISFGIIGILLGFFIGLVVSYPLGLYFGRMFGVFLFSFSISPDMLWESITGLDGFLIGDLFLIFALIGAIVGAFYAFALKIKVLSLAKYGAIGFALGSLIGPIIGNGILNLFSSLFLTYITTFFIICAFLGAFLGLGIYKNSKLQNKI